MSHFIQPGCFIGPSGITRATCPTNWEILAPIDFCSTDRNYWQSVRLFTLWLAGSDGQTFRVAWKEIRRARHHYRAKEWDDVLPKPIRQWAYQELDARSEGLSCVDNYRVALRGNTGQVRRYRRQQREGCCGSDDFERVGPDGKRYLLGYNYGH